MNDGNEGMHTNDAAWTSELLDTPHDAPDKAGRVRQMFNAIAPRYELVNSLFSGGRDAAWRREAVRLSGVRPGDDVLDIACGTGDLTRSFAKSGVRSVTGCDFAHEMLIRAADVGGCPVSESRVRGACSNSERGEFARAKARGSEQQGGKCTTRDEGGTSGNLCHTESNSTRLNEGESNGGGSDSRGSNGTELGQRARHKTTWCEADALKLPFASDSFSIVSCAFGVRNFDDLDGGLSEMRRVLRSGGRVVILEFTRPKNLMVRRLYEFYTNRIMPAAATLVSGDRSGAYRYLPRSVVSFLTAEQMLERLGRVGFRDCTATALTLGVVTVYVATRS